MLRRLPVIASLMLILAALGCGTVGSVPKKAGEALGKSVTDFGKGVGAGVDEAQEIKVELSDTLKKINITHTIAKAASGKSKGVTVYLLSQAPQQLTLTAKAFNADKQEIGRSAVDVTFSKDDAQYVTFHFDDQMDAMKVQTYFIDVKAP